MMLDVQSNFIAAARQAGVKHVVKLSGIMPELDSPFRFARMHGEIEKRLEASGIAFTHLRAGEFMPAYFRQVPTILGQGRDLPADGGRADRLDRCRRYRRDRRRRADQPRARGQDLSLTGPKALTMTEVAEQLSAATGKPIRYVNVPPEDARQAQLAAGMPPYLADALFELFAERRNGKEAKVWPDAATLLGRQPTSFDEFAKRNAAVVPRRSAAAERSEGINR